MKERWILSVLVFVFGSSVFAQKTIRIEVNNIKPIEGKIYISLYNKAKGFLEEGKEFRKLKLDVNSHTLKCEIKDIPAGDYAIALYHDKNEDGICNRSWIGIPTEGYGFSRNFKPKFVAPSFRKIKFSTEDDAIMKIKMINPR